MLLPVKTLEFCSSREIIGADNKMPKHELTRRHFCAWILRFEVSLQFYELIVFAEFRDSSHIRNAALGSS
jgi:hypothetical protein